VHAFKYCPPTVLNFGMLARGEIFFASDQELNDGSECRPRYVLKGSAELWSRLVDMLLMDACCYSLGRSTAHIRTVLARTDALASVLMAKTGKRDLDFEQLWPLIQSELPVHLQGIQLGVPQDVFMRLVKEACDLARHRLTEPTYMTSLSKTACDATMWGHYGGAERGFLLVFHAPDGHLRIRSPINMFFGSKRDEATGLKTISSISSAEVELHPVLYRSAPQRFNAFHRLIRHFNYSEEEDHYDVPLLLPSDAPARKEAQFGLVKAANWKYEQEVRAFLPVTHELMPEARCTNYDWSQLAGLAFGPKMSEADKVRAVVCCHLLQAAREKQEPRSDPFFFLQASQQSSSYQMAIDPAGVLDGFYFGESLPFRPIQAMDKATKQKALDLAKRLTAA
jgi:Protein of unknown function (DUF2971)